VRNEKKKIGSLKERGQSYVRQASRKRKERRVYQASSADGKTHTQIHTVASYSHVEKGQGTEEKRDTKAEREQTDMARDAKEGMKGKEGETFT